MIELIIRRPQRIIRSFWTNPLRGARDRNHLEETTAFTHWTKVSSQKGEKIEALIRPAT